MQALRVPQTARARSQELSGKLFAISDEFSGIVTAAAATRPWMERELLRIKHHFLYRVEGRCDSCGEIVG